MDKWQKQGLLLEPDSSKWFSQSHCSVPCPILIDEKTLRIYYATRCKDNRSRVTFIDVNPDNPKEILYRYDGICLDIGLPGMFDSDGVQPTCVIKINDKYVMYYAGYCNLLNGYYHLFSGIAESKNGINFERRFYVPFLDRNGVENTVRVAAFVFKEPNSIRYRLLYIGDNGWKELASGKKTPLYKMMYKGENYNYYDLDNPEDASPQEILIPNNENNEIGFSRPWVDRNEVYFAVRKIENDNNPYVHIEKAILYEHSELIIKRNNDIVLERSKDLLDNEMVCFPAVYKNYLFYNGNGYGKDGLLWSVR